YGLWAGIAFGFFSGFMMAFSLRAITISIKFEDRETFLSKLRTALAKIGYHPDTQVGAEFVFKPSFRAGLFASSISIELEHGLATIVGPATHVKRLLKRLKAHNQR